MLNSLVRQRTLAFIIASAVLLMLWPGWSQDSDAVGQRPSTAAPVSGDAAIVYRCPMHPKVTSQKRGKCPRCGMVLKPGSKTAPETRSKVGNSAVKNQPASDTATKNESPKPTSETSTPASSAAANYFPNHVLLTQDDKPVRFYDDMMKGKVVLINFIFTTCQGVCPPMTANLAKVQEHLADHMGKDVSMISISVDPTTDTPERLKAYAEKFKVKPGWNLLTGKTENVNLVLSKLGGFVTDKETHSSVLIIGNETTGQWMKLHAMANPKEIASAVTKLLTPKPAN